MLHHGRAGLLHQAPRPCPALGTPIARRSRLIARATSAAALLASRCCCQPVRSCPSVRALRHFPQPPKSRGTALWPTRCQPGRRMVAYPHPDCPLAILGARLRPMRPFSFRATQSTWVRAVPCVKSVVARELVDVEQEIVQWGSGFRSADGTAVAATAHGTAPVLGGQGSCSLVG